jgi:hypothetical protein
MNAYMAFGNMESGFEDSTDMYTIRWKNCRIAIQ